MPSAPLERRSSPNRGIGRDGRRPLAIVVHTTDGGLDESLAWMTDAASGVAAHYAVGLDGRSIQLVDELDAARHAGRVRDPTAPLILREGGDPNLYTVGIELDDGGAPGAPRPDVQYAAAARLIAAVASRWGFPIDHEHVIGHREVFAAKDCPGNVDLERLLREAAAQPSDAASGAKGGSLACLTPVRNAARDVEGLLASASRFADLVIALDDGSTDDTTALLGASPLVARLLRNPARETYAGWDDAANRQRLLDAAVELGADWVLFLDADERIDAGDGAALRDFLLADAIPGFAYGLRLHRTWGEGGVVPTPSVVYRAFSCASARTLPTERLHFNPVPSSIPRERWLRTTIRVRHLDSPERLEARRAKYREADPEDRFAAGSEPLLEVLGEEPVEWPERSPALGVLDVGGRRRLTCLLPARNEEDEIAGYLASASRFADVVIALDDGSTDGTAALLEASPLVARLLRNPARETYAGWDDAANRQRLLDAAVELGADWVLFLDADERIDAGDGAALRRFVDEEADPGCAYGLRVHRMIGDEQRFDAAGLWAYRLFSPRPGARLPEGRLHGVPVPSAIPRERWLRTTIRIQHRASLSAERRRDRLAKYEQADPGRRWQSNYSELVREPGELTEWRPRAAGLAVLVDSDGDGAADVDLDAPVLSAIMIAREDEATIESSVRSLVEQECSEPFEVIVVVSGSPATGRVVRHAFPNVRLIELSEPALPGAARNAGLAVARGDYVSFPGSHVELRPGSLAGRVRAHERGHTMVTGSILNGTPTRAGWASYFIDHSSALPGRPSGELGGAPAHCSYARSALQELGGFPEELRAGEDTFVNQELFQRGYDAYREREIELVHRSRCTTPARLIRHHFQRGMAMTRVMRAGEPALRGGRLALVRFLAGYSRRRLDETGARVARWGPELWHEYSRARPLVVAGVLAALAGAFVEALRPGVTRAATSGSPWRP